MKPFIALTLAMSLPVIATAQTASQKDIEAILEQQQKQIEALQKQLKQTQTQIEMTADAIDEASSNQSASSGSSKTHIGGYGELHYNNIENAEKIDFHRFVLFIDHEFSSDIRFVSELELEHSLAGDGKPGEVELEQAYIEMDLSDTSSFKAGLFLMPIGILNETHEPNTFYGVERNPVEGNIIPTTWWEAGVGYTTRFAEGWSADFSIHSGLNVDPAVYSIRGGRQKVANANADSLAYTARLKYTAIPGLEIAASYQIQDDLTQGLSDASADLFSAHLVYNTGNFTIRTLYANWNIDGTEAELLGKDEQNGYYIEPSYKLNDKWGVFARLSQWDNSAGNAVDTENEQTNIGFNYWPHANVVFKADYEEHDDAAGTSGFNLGVGYQF